MYKTKYGDTKDFNVPTTIYKMDLQNGKKYIGKTTDVDRRMDQHFSGKGAKVTKKFKPINGTVLDEVPGFFSNQVEHEYTQTYIQKHGYQNVRGGYYTNSKTLKYEPKKRLKCTRAAMMMKESDEKIKKLDRDEDDDDCDECYSSFDCDDDEW